MWNKTKELCEELNQMPLWDLLSRCGDEKLANDPILFFFYYARMRQGIDHRDHSLSDPVDVFLAPA